MSVATNPSSFIRLSNVSNPTLKSGRTPTTLPPGFNRRAIVRLRDAAHSSLYTQSAKMIVSAPATPSATLPLPSTRAQSFQSTRRTRTRPSRPFSLAFARSAHTISSTPSVQTKSASRPRESHILPRVMDGRPAAPAPSSSTLLPTKSDSKRTPGPVVAPSSRTTEGGRARSVAHSQICLDSTSPPLHGNVPVPPCTSLLRTDSSISSSSRGRRSVCFSIRFSPAASSLRSGHFRINSADCPSFAGRARIRNETRSFPSRSPSSATADSSSRMRPSRSMLITVPSSDFTALSRTFSMCNSTAAARACLPPSLSLSSAAELAERAERNANLSIQQARSSTQFFRLSDAFGRRGTADGMPVRTSLFCIGVSFN
mmetsp:Transcript_53854/g.114405  ORF Transcript_53854/g.114405 Transcript_53854/m.114405 type:complete len:371 (+) Transcript_53854:222-1334(+)